MRGLGGDSGLEMAFGGFLGVGFFGEAFLVDAAFLATRAAALDVGAAEALAVCLPFRFDGGSGKSSMSISSASSSDT